MTTHISLLTANILGLKQRSQDFADLVAEKSPSVICLQETLQRPTQRANLPGYVLLREDGCQPSRGVAIYYSSTLSASEFPIPPVDLEAQGLLLHIGATSVLLINVYYQSQRYCPTKGASRAAI